MSTGEGGGDGGGVGGAGEVRAGVAGRVVCHGPTGMRPCPRAKLPGTGRVSRSVVLRHRETNRASLWHPSDFESRRVNSLLMTAPAMVWAFSNVTLNEGAHV